MKKRGHGLDQCKSCTNTEDNRCGAFHEAVLVAGRCPAWSNDEQFDLLLEQAEIRYRQRKRKALAS